MKILAGTILIVAATVLVTVGVIACLLHPPLSLDSRDLFILSLAAAGFVFGAIAIRTLHRASRQMSRPTE